MVRGEKILILITTLTAALLLVFACTFLFTEKLTDGFSSPLDGTSDPEFQGDEVAALRPGKLDSRTLEGTRSFPSDREMIEPDHGTGAPGRVHSLEWTITGLVKKASGRPLAGAHVLLCSPVGKGNILEWNPRTGPNAEETMPGDLERESAPLREREVKSDGEGRYVFRDVPAGTYELSAWTDGYSWSVVTPVKVGGGHDSSDKVALDIILEIGRKIQGIVLDPGGRPVVDAEIKAARDSSKQPRFRGRTRSTSPDGRFVLPQLGSGRYILSARKEGYLPAFASNIQAGSEGVVITMKPTASVNGTVRTLDTGRPPDGFSILVCSIITTAGGESKNPIREWEAFQVQDGRFEIRGLSRGRYVLAARGKGYGDGYSLPFSLEEGDSFGPVEIVLGRGFDVRGVVMDSKGNPLAGARAELIAGSAATKPLLSGIMGMTGRADSRTAPSLSRTALTDEAGRFRIESASPGLYTLRVTHPEFRDFMLKEVAVDSRDVELPGRITLEKGGTLEGSVLARAGEPLRDQWVAVAGLDVDARHYVRTGGDGSFRIGRLTPGEYEVSLLEASAPFKGNRPRPLSGPSGSKIVVRVGEGEKIEAVLHAP